KFAFLWTSNFLASFQLRGTAPTGNADRGLGTNHYSVEPALLFNFKPIDDLVLEGEIRYWYPIQGTEFAGDVVRVGLGASLGERSPDGPWFTPVAELVAWRVLDGKALVVDGPTSFSIRSADGDTIVNGMFGLRMGFGTIADVYLGYSRAFTGPA